MANSPKQTVSYEPGFPLDDFEVEAFYQANKHNTEVKTSSCLVVTRFRVGVAERDILPFKLSVFCEEFDSPLECVIEEDGRYILDYDDTVLDQYGDLLTRLLISFVQDKNEIES